MKKLNHLVLAEGESTGHAHRASSGKLFEGNNGLMVLDPDEETIVTHEEHHATPTLKEIFGNQQIEVQRVQEFNHAEQEAANVAD